MKKLLKFAFLLVFCVSNAQQITIPVRFVSRIDDVPGKYIGNDAFEWQYTVTDNILRKSKDREYVEYKNLSLGDIEKADILNPLQIVIFYENFNTVVLLDNQLNETARINFSNLPDPQQEPLIAAAAGLAGQNNLWIFDVNTQRLGLYNLIKKEFKPITPPFAEEIKFYQSDYNYFYWIDDMGKFYISNLFGKINFIGNIPPFDIAQVISQDSLLLKKDNNLYIYNTTDESLKRVEIVEKSFTGFHYAAQILSIFTDKEINQYKVILPE